VNKRAHGRSNRVLLSTARRRRRDKDASILPSKRSFGPETSSRVKEGLELPGHRSVSGRNAKQESVKVDQLLGGDDGDVLGLGRCVDDLQNVFREGLGDTVDGCFAACGFDTGLDGSGHYESQSKEMVEDIGRKKKREPGQQTVHVIRASQILALVDVAIGRVGDDCDARCHCLTMCRCKCFTGRICSCWLRLLYKRF